MPARDFRDALLALDLELKDDDARELCAAFAPPADPDSVNYRDFLKFVRDAGGRSGGAAGPRTPRAVDATTAYDGFFDDDGSDELYGKGPAHSPLRSRRPSDDFLKRRDLFEQDDPMNFSVPAGAWR